MHRRLEFALIYLAGPAVGWVLIRLQPHAVIPLLLVGGLVALTILARDPAFARQEWGWNGSTRSVITRVLVVWALVAVGLVTWALLAVPEYFLRFPTEHPRRWLALLALYPILSALPQEILFRTLFFHRYGALFPGPQWRIAANSLVFGWAHIVMGNLPCLVATALLGLLLAVTYERFRSLLVVTLEHALYGCLVFSLGLGLYFVPRERTAEMTSPPPPPHIHTQ
ncbi:MAG: CPBP family glutamic-type intramembrane protease [Candidatus Methylacidiphilales bacterium]|nr:CPBP family glutamic-type intramembrane protease [Candidatus Methylacidiphilales bacterium]